MALQKALEFGNTGLTGNYWKVIETRINYWTRSAVVVLYQWANQAARLAGKQWLSERQYSWSGDNFPFDVVALDTSNPVKTAYEAIKARDEFFADAVDC